MIQESDILSVLLEIAHKDQRAIVPLLKLAEIERHAEWLMRQDSWLDLGLPGSEETLKLLFVALGSLENAPPVSSRVVQLFVRAVTDGKENHMALVAGILKRIDLTETFVEELKEQDFFREFMRGDRDCNWEVADQALFDAFRTIAFKVYVPEMLDVCDLACKQLGSNGRACMKAAEFIIEACEYQPCRKKLRKARVLETFQAMSADPVIAQLGARLGKLLKS
jgi:hypothetical protein